MRIEYFHLKRPYAFPEPFGKEDYALLLFAADSAVTREEQSTLCTAIVHQGCRAAVCAGHACEDWHDGIDSALLEKCDYDVGDDDFIMTSWHAHDDLKDVIFFLFHCTGFDDWRPKRFLVVVIGGDGHTVTEIRNEVERQVATE